MTKEQMKQYTDIIDLINDLYDEGYSLYDIHSCDELAQIAKEELDKGNYIVASWYTETLAEVERSNADFVCGDSCSNFEPLTNIEQVIEIAEEENEE